jgi:alkylhydroperoxidase/carboxymuconolactone decarboxylase family protein YurZ
MSTESWKSGALTAKEREFVCIGINCTVTHIYEPGLRRHIRKALGYGATREEICEIFQLAAVLGLEGYVIGAAALFGTSEDR